jgi:ADP-ribose pyrophosphatase
VVDLPGTSGDEQFYGLALADYVTVLALTEDEQVVLVRQYRPVIERLTLELPSGAVDPGEEPEQTARRELLEETGFVSDSWVLLGALTTDVGRLQNRQWSYLARDARRTAAPYRPEAGIEAFTMPLPALVAATATEFDAALNIAVVGLALIQGAISLPPAPSPLLSHDAIRAVDATSAQDGGGRPQENPQV